MNDVTARDAAIVQQRDHGMIERQLGIAEEVISEHQAQQRKAALNAALSLSSIQKASRPPSS
jgi:hypothetical protein